MRGNRGLNTHVIDGIGTRCDGRQDKTKGKWKEDQRWLEGRWLRPPNTARTRRGTNFGGSRDSIPKVAFLVRCIPSSMNLVRTPDIDIFFKKRSAVLSLWLGCLVSRCLFILKGSMLLLANSSLHRMSTLTLPVFNICKSIFDEVGMYFLFLTGTRLSALMLTWRGSCTFKKRKNLPMILLWQLAYIS